MRVWLLLVCCVIAQSATAAEDCGGPVSCAIGVVKHEAVRYAHDAKSLSTAPLRWDRATWQRFGEGVVAVVALYETDRQTADSVQRNRSSFSNDFAKTITPFGGHRALEMSLLMIATGAGFREPALRDAGRDSLESELWAAGIVTPLLKSAFGRARPSQDEGAHSFHPGNGHFQSFPSGHATNAFAFATAVAGHYDGWIIPTIVYTMASGVAVSRVNDRAHFPADVLAGALIGHAVAKGIVARHTGRSITWQATPLISHDSVGVMFVIGRAKQ